MWPLNHDSMMDKQVQLCQQFCLLFSKLLPIIINCTSQGRDFSYDLILNSGQYWWKILSKKEFSLYKHFFILGRFSVPQVLLFLVSMWHFTNIKISLHKYLLNCLFKWFFIDKKETLNSTIWNDKIHMKQRMPKKIV